MNVASGANASVKSTAKATAAKISHPLNLASNILETAVGSAAYARNKVAFMAREVQGKQNLTKIKVL